MWGSILRSWDSRVTSTSRANTCEIPLEPLLARARAQTDPALRSRSPPGSRPSLVVLGDYPGQLRWLVPVLVALGCARGGRARRRRHAPPALRRRAARRRGAADRPVRLGRRHARSHAQRHLPGRRPGRGRRAGLRPGTAGRARRDAAGRERCAWLRRTGRLRRRGECRRRVCALRRRIRSPGLGLRALRRRRRRRLSATRSAQRCSSYVKAHGGGTIAVSRPVERGRLDHLLRRRRGGDRRFLRP